MAIVIKRRRGRSYFSHIDWDDGKIMTSTNPDEAMEFTDAESAKTFAKDHGIPAADWRLVRRG